MSARIVSHYVGLTDVEVTLTNTSDRALALGYVMNEKDHPAVGMKFAMTDARGVSWEVGYWDGFMEGKIEPLVVDAPAGGAYVFDIPTDRLPLRHDYDKNVAQFVGAGGPLSR